MRRREPNRQNWNFGHKANCQCPTCVEDRRLRFHGEEIRKADSVSCPECKGEGRVIAIGSGEAIRCPLCLGNGWLPKHFAEARARRLAEGQRRASRGKQPDLDYDALLRESREYYARIKAEREQSKPSGPRPPTPPTRQVWDEELGQMVNVQPAKPKERRPDRHARPENETSRRRPERGPDARLGEHPPNRYTKPDTSALIQDIEAYPRPKRGKKILVMAAVVAVLAFASVASYLQYEQNKGTAQIPPSSVALPSDSEEPSDIEQPDAMVPTFAIIPDKAIPPDEAYRSLASQSVSVDGVGLGHPPEYGYPDMLGTAEFQRALGECGGSLHIRSELSWHLQVTDSWLLLNEPFSPLRNDTTSILWWLYSTDGALSASGSIDADCAVHVLHPAPTPTPTPTPTLTPTPVTTPSTAPPPMPVPTPTPTATPIPTATPTPSPVPTPTPTPTPTQRFPGGQPLDAAVIETWVIHYTNEEREKHGLAPFAHDEAISRIARGHSHNMIIHGYGHTVLGQDPTDRALSAGYDCRAYYSDGSYSYGLSENIYKLPRVTLWMILGGRGRPSEYLLNGPTAAKALVDGWMNSPGHRANILDRDARKIGVGVAIEIEEEYGYQSETMYATQNFSACR